MKSLLMTVAAVLSMLAVGCVEGQSIESEVETDELGDLRQALEEPACATFSLTSTGNKDGITRSTFGTQTSPDWTYNPSTACPAQYIVEYTNLPSASAYKDHYVQPRPKGGWGNITNEHDCERTHVLAGYYTWSTSTSAVAITSEIIDGQWAGGVCTPSPKSPGLSVEGDYKVRVAARTLFCAFDDGCNDTQRTNLKAEVEAYSLDVAQ